MTAPLEELVAASGHCDCESRDCLQEKKILKTILEENSLKFQLVFEHTTEYILLLDRHLHVVHANKVFKEKFGESMPSSILEMFTPSTRGGIARTLEKHLSNSVLASRGIPLSCIHQSISMPEQPVAHRNLNRIEELKGSTRVNKKEEDSDEEWVDALLLTCNRAEVPVEVKVGEWSSQKEDYLQYYGVVILRDAELKSKAIAATQAAFEADLANRAKGLFLAKMSHEIRTPVHGILGMAQLLNEEGLTSEQREYTELILKSSEALLKVINDILDFSKVEQGKMEIENVPFIVTDMVSSVVELCKSKAVSKGLELFVYVAPNFPTLRGDPGRLRQVLLNILWNAIKFTTRGHIIISVKIAYVTKTHVKALFEIEDQGCGIAPGDFRKIFTQFNQFADSETQNREGGTGLGLAISKQIVHLMGGRIWASSVPQKGSVFSFDCMLELCQKDQAENQIEFPFKEPRHHACILIHPDTEAMSRTYGRHFRSWHIPNTTARSPDIATIKAAYERLYTADVKNVVLFTTLSILKIVRGTMTLPSFKKLIFQEVLKVKAGVRPPKLHIVAFTLREERNRARVLGVDVVIGKPAYRGELFRCLDLLLEHEGTSKPQPREIMPVKGTGSEEEDNSGLRLLPASLRILVVEDNPTNMTVCLRMLQKLGLKCDTAYNGKEAVEKVVDREYDIVLMDCNMPIMDGYEAAATIRNLSKTTGNGKSKRQLLRASKTPIIAVTASAMRGDREKCLNVGMNDYISKPYKSEQLYAVLKRIAPISLRLAASGGRDQLSSPTKKENVEVKEEKNTEATEPSGPRELPISLLPMTLLKQAKQEAFAAEGSGVVEKNEGRHEGSAGKNEIGVRHIRSLMKDDEEKTIFHRFGIHSGRNEVFPRPLSSFDQSKYVRVDLPSSRSALLASSEKQVGSTKPERRIFIDSQSSTAPIPIAEESNPQFDEDAFGECLSRSPSPSLCSYSEISSPSASDNKGGVGRRVATHSDPEIAKKAKEEEEVGRVTRVPQWNVMNKMESQRSKRLQVLNMAEMLSELHEDEGTDLEGKKSE